MLTKTKKIIANWKMYKVWTQILAYHTQIERFLAQNPNIPSFGLCVSTIYLYPICKLFAHLPQVKIYAQNCSEQEQGAYTGNVAYTQLQDCGVCGSLIGHSECRHFFIENEVLIRNKTHKLLTQGMEVILCVGEQWHEYQNKQSLDVVLTQIKMALMGTQPQYYQRLMIAYEPVWAIGTGNTASHLEVNKLLETIKKELNSEWDSHVFDNIPFLYGGSVNVANAPLFLSQKGIDGLLVGKSSLEAFDFCQLLSLCLKNP